MEVLPEVQTFIVSSDPASTAKKLDRQRLGKQRVEALQILRTLLGESDGWKNHPAVKMWRGHEGDLAFYGLVMCEEWISRGYMDTCASSIRSLCKTHRIRVFKRFRGGPDHLYRNRAFIRSHRSNLLRKNPEHYSQFGWKVPSNLPYVWPEG